MNCVGCNKPIKKGEFVTLNGGAMVRTKTGAVMGGKNLLGFLVINNHFDSKKNYRSVNISHDGPNGQFEFYACSHKCMANFISRQIMLLDKLDKIKKIEMACDKKVQKFGPWVDKVLRILGHPDALVTDLSSIWDFIGLDKKEKFLSKWEKKLGFKIKESDYIWRVAKKLQIEESLKRSWKMQQVLL